MRLFISEKIDLLESADMAERIIKLFKNSKSAVFPERDWKNMQISQIVFDILEAKKLMLSDRGSYSYVSDPLVRRRIQDRVKYEEILERNLLDCLDKRQLIHVIWISKLMS